MHTFNNVKTRLIVPDDYREKFEKAVLTFRHQRVYDPNSKSIVHINDFPEESYAAAMKKFGNLDFIGPEIPPELVSQHVQGILNPITKEPYIDENSTVRSNIAPHVKATTGNQKTIHSFFKKAPVAQIQQQQQQQQQQQRLQIPMMPITLVESNVQSEKQKKRSFFGSASASKKTVTLNHSSYFAVSTTSSSTSSSSITSLSRSIVSGSGGTILSKNTISGKSLLRKVNKTEVSYFHTGFSLYF